MPTKPPQHRAKRKRPPTNDDRPSPCKRGYGRAWKRSRMTVYVRDGGRCCECRQVISQKGKWHIDHITPLSCGGSGRLDNLQLMCIACHSRKTATEDGGFGRAAKADAR